MILEIASIMIERFHPDVGHGPLVVSEEDILKTCLQCSLFFLRELGAPTSGQIRRSPRSGETTLRKTFFRWILREAA